MYVFIMKCIRSRDPFATTDHPWSIAVLYADRDWPIGIHGISRDVRPYICHQWLYQLRT